MQKFVIKKKALLITSVIFFYFSNSICFSQPQMHWNWTEIDTVFNRSGIFNLPTRCTVKFADVDDDNKVDLIIGNKDNIRLYQKSKFEKPIIWKLQSQYFQDIQKYHTTGFDCIDIDCDGNKEFITSKHMSGDNFKIWKDIGTIDNPEWISNSINFEFLPLLEFYFFMYPEFKDFDQDGDLDIVCMRQSNNQECWEVDPYYYENIGSDSFAIWQADSAFFENLYQGYSSSFPTFVDIDNDSDFDLFYLSYVEDVSFLTGYLNISVTDSTLWTKYVFPSTTQNFLRYGDLYDFDWFDFDYDYDYDLDLIISRSKNICYFENIGSPDKMNFSKYPQVWGGFKSGSKSYAFVHDFDEDGDYNLGMIGYQEGFVYDYLVTHSYMQTEDGWQEVSWLNLNENINLKTWFTGYLTVSLIDFDGDYDLDISIFTASYYEDSGGFDCFLIRNIGDNRNFQFQIDRNYLDTLNTFSRLLRPTFGDLDDDGDIDMMAIDSNKVKFFKNGRYDFPSRRR